jgi:hypothetical protein
MYWCIPVIRPRVIGHIGLSDNPQEIASPFLHVYSYSFSFIFLYSIQPYPAYFKKIHMSSGLFIVGLLFIFSVSLNVFIIDFVIIL